MRIIAVSTLKRFWEARAHSGAEQPLRTWVKVTKAAAWPDPASVKASFNSADILKGGRVVFDIGGNKYRIVAHINYEHAIVYIRFVGTHGQYDQIDARNV